MMFDSLFRLWRRQQLARSRHARPTAQPQLEALEVRWVPSTVTDNLTPSALAPNLSAAPATPAMAAPTVAAPACSGMLVPTIATGSTPDTTSTTTLAPTPTPPACSTGNPSSPSSSAASGSSTSSTGTLPSCTDTLGDTTTTSTTTALSVDPPVAVTPAPVNPTNTAIPVQISTPASTPTPPQSTSTNTSSDCTSMTSTSTSTTSTDPLVTIPEYTGSTSTNDSSTTPVLQISPPSNPPATSPTGLVIGGTVYEDKNNNGLLDPGEPGISNNEIMLEDASHNVIATTTTNSNGQYQFTTNQALSTSPQAKNQQVVFNTAPTDYTQSQAVQQFNPALGTLNSVQIIEQGQLTSDIKVENLGTSPAQVTGTVSGLLTLSAPGFSTLSLNPTGTETNTLGAFDGTIDFAGTSGYDFGSQTAQKTQTATISASDTNLAAWIGTGQVNLTQTATATSSADGPGNVVSKIQSDAGANVEVIYNYTPTNALQPGTYTVVQGQVPPGYTSGQLTSNNQTPFPPNGPPNSIPVTLTSGSSTNNNFGELVPSSLSGFVYLDKQNDGKFDSGDPGMPGVTVKLTNSQGTPVSQQVTGSDGSYSFTNLAPGTYTLTVVTPSGYVSTDSDPGNLINTAATPTSITMVVPENAQGTDYDFGLQTPPASPPPPASNPGTPTSGPSPSSPGSSTTPVNSSSPSSTPTGNPSSPFSKRLFIGTSWGDLIG